MWFAELHPALVRAAASVGVAPVADGNVCSDGSDLTSCSGFGE